MRGLYESYSKLRLPTSAGPWLNTKKALMAFDKEAIITEMHKLWNIKQIAKLIGNLQRNTSNKFKVSISQTITSKRPRYNFRKQLKRNGPPALTPVPSYNVDSVDETGQFDMIDEDDQKRGVLSDHRTKGNEAENIHTERIVNNEVQQEEEIIVYDDDVDDDSNNSDKFALDLESLDITEHTNRDNTLPDGWIELHDEQGTPYYHHQASQSTQWERPQRSAYKRSV